MHTRLFLALLSLLLFACNKSGGPIIIKDDTAIKDVYGSWRLVSRENYTTGEVFYKDAQVQRYCRTTNQCDVIINLSKGNPTDIITGHTITNVISGSFRFDAVSRTFTTLEFGGTKVGEPSWGDNLWNNMHSIRKYSVNPRYLRLFFNDDKQSLTFARE
jgi:hypothetical protein